MGLRHGARQLLEEIEAYEEDAFDCLSIAIQRIKGNPQLAIDKIREAEDAIKKARDIRRNRLPEMLQKAAPNLEQKVKELETEIAFIREWIARQENVTQFRKAQ